MYNIKVERVNFKLEEIFLKNKCLAFFSHKKQEIDIALKSLLVGLASGGVAILYRLALASAEKISFYLYSFVNNHLIYLPFLFLSLITMGYLVGCLIESDEIIAGSGIPHLKKVVKKYFDLRMPWFYTLIKKFIGGVIAIFAGLSLGRGGPSIHLGTCVAEGIGNKIGSNSMQRKMLVASGASAGLAATFNAPIAAVIFVIEGVFKYFSLTILLSTALGAFTADYISKKIFGMESIFDFSITQAIPFNNGYITLILLGIILGILGSCFNLTLLKMEDFYKRLDFFSIRTKPIIPFIVAGFVGLLFPIAIGSGFKMVEYLSSTSTIKFLLVALLIKYVFSLICLGSDTPGGIFFPSLIIGAVIGSVFGYFMIKNVIFEMSFFNNFIILGMAGYISAVLRAPITGIVLILEMTGATTDFLSVIVVSVSAYMISEYIYKIFKYQD